MSFMDSLPATARRDLRTAVWARAISLLGDEMALVALLLRTQARGGGAWPVVALLMAGTLPLVLLAPIVGRLVDRFDSRGLLVGSALGQLICCSALAYQQQTAAVLLLVALMGAGQAVNGATWQALLPRIVGVERLPAALGTSQAAGTAASILAPVLGGVLTGWQGARLPLLLDAASFAVIALAGLLVRTRRGGLANTSGPAGDARGGLAILRADRTLLRLVVLLTAFILLAGTVNVVEIFLVRQSLHASAGWYGVLGGSWGLGLLAGALLGGRLRTQVALLRATVASCLGVGVALVGMGLAPAVGWVLPATLLGGVSNGTVNVSIGAVLGIRCTEAVRGRLSATAGGLATAGQIGALLLGGLLAATLSPRLVFALSGGLGVLVALGLGRPLLAASAADPPAGQNLENAWPTSSPNNSSGSRQ
jgi:MFS family permease